MVIRPLRVEGKVAAWLSVADKGASATRLRQDEISWRLCFGEAGVASKKSSAVVIVTTDETD